MGVDQYTSTHKFDALPTGGRIELRRDTDDSVGVAQIRAHIRDIAHAFMTGDFSTPAFVHMQMVPGTDVMREKREVISYQPRDLPRGAELIIRTSDPAALQAIHQFMAFQRGEHHADGKRHTPQSFRTRSSRALGGPKEAKLSISRTVPMTAVVGFPPPRFVAIA